MNMETPSHRAPTLIEAVIPLIAVALLLGVGYGVYHLPAEILLLAATAVAGLVAWRIGYSWRELEMGIVESIAKGTPATLIVIVVGALIGSWITAGTIPMLVYFGLKLISPAFFLVTALHRVQRGFAAHRHLMGHSRNDRCGLHRYRTRSACAPWPGSGRYRRGRIFWRQTLAFL